MFYPSTYWVAKVERIEKNTSTVVDRKKNRKVSTERHESKQQAQRITGVNIDSRWAPQSFGSYF